MVSTPQPPVPPQHLAHQLRERFVHALDAFIAELAERNQAQLLALGQGGVRGVSLADMQLAMDTEAAFRRERQAWVAAARRHWREAWTQMADARGVPGGSLPADLGLLDDEIVERKIAASRLGAAVQDASGAEFNDLRLRVQSLERSSDLPARDVLRPDTFGQQLLKAWADRGLTRPMWALVHPVVQAAMVERMVPLYRQANAFLVERGVMAEINLKALVRRGEGDAGGRGGGSTGAGTGTGGAHGGAGVQAASALRVPAVARCPRCLVVVAGKAAATARARRAWPRDTARARRCQAPPRRPRAPPTEAATPRCRTCAIRPWRALARKPA